MDKFVLKTSALLVQMLVQQKSIPKSFGMLDIQVGPVGIEPTTY